MSILILVVISILTSSIILILKMHPLSFVAHSRLSRSRIFKTHQQGHLFHLHSGPGPPGMGRPNSYSSMWGQCGALFNVAGGWIKDMPTSHLSLFLSLFCVAPPHPSADRSVTTVVWYDSVFGGRRLPPAGQPLRLDLHAPGGPGQDHHGEGAVGRASISFCVSMWSVQTNQWHSQGIVSLEQRQKKG